MSGPNSQYDPVQVTPLNADEVDAMREAALSAAAAATDLDELKAARGQHAGDRSPLALANREIGALPPQARKDAGMRVGQARGAVSRAFAAREAELAALKERSRAAHPASMVKSGAPAGPTVAVAAPAAPGPLPTGRTAGVRR